MSLAFRCAAFVCLTAVGVALAAFASAMNANAAKGVIGTLTCEIEGGKSFIFGSTKGLHCVFCRTKGRSEAYFGTIKKFGVDIGVTGPSTLVWTVIARSRSPSPGELSGKYVGASAGAAVIAQSFHPGATLVATDGVAPPPLIRAAPGDFSLITSGAS